MKLTGTIFLMCLYYVLCEDCVLDNGSRDLNKERKLHKDVLCNYDMFKPPDNTTFVAVYFKLKYFNFDSNEELLTMYTWLILSWNDARLKWDPKDYDDIDESEFKAHEIWLPNLKQHTKIIYDEFEQIVSGMCQVSSNGHVHCLLHVLSKTECSTNLVRWPYDSQNCTFEFGVHKILKDNLVFTFNSSRGMSMFGAEYGPGWNIMGFEKGENASSDKQFYLSFVLERQAESLGAITVFPLVVLSTLTIASMFLDVDKTRGGIAILSLWGHFYIQSFVSFAIPINSSTVPSILDFIIMSLSITTASILLTITLSCLCRKKDSPHHWVVGVNEFVFKSSIRYLIWPRWESKELETASSEAKSAFEIWIDFANIINSTSIVIVVIMYVSMFVSLVPKPIPY